MILDLPKDDSFESICQRLRRDDPSLTLVNWNNRGIGGTFHCDLLAQALRHNHHAVVLFLQQNQIRTVRQLGSAVQFLYLSGNAGLHLTCLVDAVLQQNELRVLTLAQCDLHQVDELVRLVSSCHTLRKLDLSGNPKLGVRMTDILRAARHLEYIDMTGCCCEESSFPKDDDSSLDDTTQLLELRMMDRPLLPVRWRYCLALNQAGRRHWGEICIPASLYPRLIQKAARVSPDASFRLLKERPDMLIYCAK